jgi:hypothetical protein
LPSAPNSAGRNTLDLRYSKALYVLTWSRNLP